MTRHVFERSVAIDRTLAEVFGFVADATRMPLWNSAVTSVEPASDSAYVMRRRLPTGDAENGLAVIELEPPTVFAVRTTYGPTPFTYRYRFAEADGATVVTLAGEIEFGGVYSLLPVRAFLHGIDANLTTLRQLLERGHN
jgi:Polyketide cyclase / dehydrase and lipid transport